MSYKNFLVGAAVDRVSTYDICIRARTAKEAENIAQKQLDQSGIEAFGFVDEETVDMRIRFVEEQK